MTSPSALITRYEKPKYCLAIKPEPGADIATRCARPPGHDGKHRTWHPGVGVADEWDATDDTRGVAVSDWDEQRPWVGTAKVVRKWREEAS